MSNLLIRNIPEATITALDEQAMQVGMSRESYVRQHLERLATRSISFDSLRVAAELDELDRIADEIAKEYPNARAGDALDDLRREL
jgi:plasmid stability protein